VGNLQDLPAFSCKRTDAVRSRLEATLRHDPIKPDVMATKRIPQ
jgi:hypothetical protein